MDRSAAATTPGKAAGEGRRATQDAGNRVRSKAIEDALKAVKKLDLPACEYERIEAALNPLKGAGRPEGGDEAGGAVAGAAESQAQPRKAEACRLFFTPRAGAPPTQPAAKAEAKAAGTGEQHRIDPVTGKVLQRTVNAKKTQEEEARRAAEMIQALAEAAEAAETSNEKDDGGEEAGDEEDGGVAEHAWDAERRKEVAEAAWRDQDAAAVGPAMGGPDRALPFAVVLPLLAGAATEAATLRGVATLLRQVLHHSSDKESDLKSVMTILLSSRRTPVVHKILADAISDSFGMPAGKLREEASYKLPEQALAGRRKQMTLSRRRLLAADVAVAIDKCVAPKCKQEVQERLTKLFAASSKENEETSRLVRVLQSRPGLSWDVALRGLAHAAALPPPSGGEAPTPAGVVSPDALVDAEDKVLQAYSQDGARIDRLVAALARGQRGEALVAACAPGCEVGQAPIVPMRAREATDDVGAALANLRECGGPAFAEWRTRGDQAQVHVKDDGAIIVFGKNMEQEPALVGDATLALKGHLEGVRTCILDVVFVRHWRKSAAKEGPEVAKGCTASEDRGSERSVLVRDLLVLNGNSLLPLPWKERHAELRRVVKEHAHLRLVQGSEVPSEALHDETRIMALLTEALTAATFATGDEKAFKRADGLVLKSLDSPYLAGCCAGTWQALARPPVKGADADRLLLESLPEEAKSHIPSTDEIYFSVVSAFRTDTTEGVRDIMKVQKLYNSAGVQPIWYTDEQSADSYRRLGLKVIPGGKLVPSRNKALDDAAKEGKVCVQTSDDIGSWTLYNDWERYTTDSEANAAALSCMRIESTPVAAAKFLIAMMRSRGPGVCRLAGVYPLSNAGRCLRARPVADNNFILGDFFAAEVSPCRFETRLSLKEDYDFTCSHLQAFGQVCRVNRMIIAAKHETNAGGACQVRDAAGKKEQENIAILKEKWPNNIRGHNTRANQVVLYWRSASGGSGRGKKRKAEDTPTGATENQVKT